VNQGFLDPELLLSLGAVDGLARIDADGGELRLGAMARHRAIERAPETEAWPALRRAFGLVASPRVRNQATVGGVLADADYASDPPAMLAALGARAVLRSPDGEREVGIEDLILGHYEDRPCVAVAAVRDRAGLRVVVGAVAETPQHFADVCALAGDRPPDAELAAEIGRRYAERIASTPVTRAWACGERTNAAWSIPGRSTCTE
jgi:carbon-monoxide dehydrogenase medium subunit